MKSTMKLPQQRIR